MQQQRPKKPKIPFEDEHRCGSLDPIIEVPEGVHTAEPTSMTIPILRAVGPDEGAPDWRKLAQKTAKGELVCNTRNALTALRNIPELAGSIAFDQMALTSIVRRELPGHEGEAQTVPRNLTDNDVTQIQVFLQNNGLTSIGQKPVLDAVMLYSRENAFHPVRDYLNALEWRGQKRLDTFLHRYLGAEDSVYSSKIGRMFLIAMVARVFEPGCKFDCMLVLEGEQGTGKSTACSILAGEWFSENLPDLKSKDASQHLKGRWLVEIAEMSAMTNMDDRALKSFISRQVERYRPSYGKLDTDERRQCVFVATTNEAKYLRDATGARRYWPVKVGLVDLKALEADRDQIFAEAVAAYKGGERWWPDRDTEERLFRPEQDSRFEEDAWTPMVAEFLDGRDKVLTYQIGECVGIGGGRCGTSESRRIRAILLRLGWEEKRTNKGRFYFPKAKK